MDADDRSQEGSTSSQPQNPNVGSGEQPERDEWLAELQEFVEASEVKRPAPIQRLFDALVHVEVCTDALAREWREIDRRRSSGIKPDEEDWPHHAPARRARAEEFLKREREHAAKTGGVAVLFVPKTHWAQAMLDLRDAYRLWNKSIREAIDAVPVCGKLMDAGEPRLAERFTSKVMAALRNLHGIAHPVSLGPDGMGIVKGHVPLPPNLQELIKPIQQYRLVLFDVVERGKTLSADRSNLRSYTQSEVDDAIRRYRASRSAKYSELKAAIDRGDESARSAAQKLFGRNAVARHLRCRSSAMVSDSAAWRAIAKDLQLDGKRLKRPERVGLEVAIEQHASDKKDAVVDAASASDVEARLRRLGDAGEALRQAVGSGQMTQKQMLAALVELERRGKD